MEVQKGDYVVTNESGSGSYVQGYGSASYKAGEELVVTSKNAYGLNVRKTRGGRVFKIGSAKVRPVLRPLGQVPDGGIEPDDPRIAWIFEDAARLADRLGLCRDFDRVADGIGVPGRERNFTIKFEVAAGVELTAKVVARSRRQAESKLRGTLVEQPPAIKSIGAGA